MEGETQFKQEMKTSRLLNRPLSSSVILSLLVAASLATLPSTVRAFSLAGPKSGLLVSRSAVSSTFTRATVLFGKVKRGKLSSNVDVDDAVTTRKPKASQTSSKGKAKPGKGASNEEKISPLLAQWAAQSSSSDTAVTKEASDDAPASTINLASTFESFDDAKGKSKKNQKKPSVRQIAQTVRDETASALVSQMLDVLNSESKQKDINDILNPIKQLVTLTAATEQGRTLLLSQSRNDYNLAWVGSDDALCHVGTGLHKVPLARMQDVFLSLPGRNRVELLEVIRVLGPFPNVKNILQGTANTKSMEEVADWIVTYDSMIDGTGKELLAGKEENIRKVLLQIYFCTEQAVVAVVPPNVNDPSERRKDIFEQSGKNILVFVKEDDLDLKLDKYRVS